jgi:HprK-related kinase B
MGPWHLQELASSWSAGQDDSQRLGLVFGDCRIELRSNSAELVKKLQKYFRGFTRELTQADMVITALEAPAWRPDLALTAKLPDPGKHKIKEEFLDLDGGRLVRKRLTGMAFLLGPDSHLAYGPCVANDNQVVNFINSRHIQWMLERGWLLCHAAGVAQGGRGLALAGVSGAGKSTLALHLLNQGLDFVSNDRLLIRRGEGRLAMSGVAKLPRINPGTALNNPALQAVLPGREAAEFARLPQEELWSLEHKYDVFIDECFGKHRFRLSSAMSGLAVLSWQRDGGEAVVRSVDIAGRPDLLAAFMKAPGLFYLANGKPPAADTAPDPAAYIQALKNTPVYEISGGVDFPRAVAACQELLAGAGEI